MQKVIIDTNVIVSALISQGIPSKILTELVLKNKVQLQLSSATFSEYVEVLMRPKFGKTPNFQLNAEVVISRLEELAVVTESAEKLNIIGDEKDNRFLELAISTQANFLITGNTRDFTISELDGTKIISPSTYWENYRPE